MHLACVFSCANLCRSVPFDNRCWPQLVGVHVVVQVCAFFFHVRLDSIGLATSPACAQTPVYLDAQLPTPFSCQALPHKARAPPWRYWFGDEDSMCANASLFGCSAPGVLLLASAVSRSKSLYSVSIKRSAGSGRS